jgi:hypothetical protein
VVPDVSLEHDDDDDDDGGAAFFSASSTMGGYSSQMWMKSTCSIWRARLAGDFGFDGGGGRSLALGTSELIVSA